MDILIKIALYASYSFIVVYFLQIAGSFLAINALKNNENNPPLLKVLGTISYNENIKNKVLYRILPLTIFTSLLTWGF